MPMIQNGYLGWIAKFNRQISDVDEFLTRLERFSLIDDWINEHNASGNSWKAAHN